MLRSYLGLVSLIALILPLKISAEGSSTGDNWNIVNDLLDQCAQIERYNPKLNSIAQKLWQISEIPYGLRTASSECLNKFFDNEVVYTWDAGSFRHSMRDRLRAVNCPTEMIDQLGGWSRDTIGQGYGAGYDLIIINEYLVKVLL